MPLDGQQYLAVNYLQDTYPGILEIAEGTGQDATLAQDIIDKFDVYIQAYYDKPEDKRGARPNPVNALIGEKGRLERHIEKLLRDTPEADRTEAFKNEIDAMEIQVAKFRNMWDMLKANKDGEPPKVTPIKAGKPGDGDQPGQGGNDRKAAEPPPPPGGNGGSGVDIPGNGDAGIDIPEDDGSNKYGFPWATFVGGAAIGLWGAAPTIGAKILCTTALTPIMGPLAYPAAGFIFGAGAGIINKYREHDGGLRGAWTQEGGWSLAKHIGGRAILGGATAFAFMEGAEYLANTFGDNIKESFNIDCAAADVDPNTLPDGEVLPPNVEPEAGEAGPGAADCTDGEGDAGDAGGADAGEEAPEGGTAETPEDCPPVEVTALTAEDVFDPTVFVDGNPGENPIVEDFIEHATANGVDPSNPAIQALAGQVEAGFDFVDSDSCGEAVNFFNTMLEAAMDPTSPGGADVTPEEYQAVLEGFAERLADGDFITMDNDPTTFQDSVLDQDASLSSSEERAQMTQKFQDLRLSM